MKKSSDSLGRRIVFVTCVTSLMSSQLFGVITASFESIQDTSGQTQSALIIKSTEGKPSLTINKVSVKSKSDASLKVESTSGTNKVFQGASLIAEDRNSGFYLFDFPNILEVLHTAYKSRSNASIQDPMLSIEILVEAGQDKKTLVLQDDGFDK